jgi:hypothetical protein
MLITSVFKEILKYFRIFINVVDEELKNGRTEKCRDCYKTRKKVSKFL